MTEQQAREEMIANPPKVLITNYAMLEHPYPKKILIIGGGTGGAINQILKHKIDRIDYVELDPLVISLSQKYMPPITDDRVNIVHTDGRSFVKYVGAGLKPARTYDVVIVNLPDPYTAILNRFYSLEFFQEVKKILEPRGIFSFALLSSENYISPENAIYLSCIYNTLKKEFSNIKLLPGDTITFIASEEPGLLTQDVNILIKRLKERNIKTKFVREYYLPFKLDPLRIKYVESAIQKFQNTKINTDFKPIGYLYHAVLWISFFDATRNLLPYIDKINILEATKLAMAKALRKLKVDYLILDGNFKIKSAIPQKSIVKADEKVFSCSCASIIAKVTRDRIMMRYHKKYPQYGFAQHKGYPTRFHRAMLNKYGRCAIHRNSFHYRASV